jgi:hypothetical protein
MKVDQDELDIYIAGKRIDRDSKTGNLYGDRAVSYLVSQRHHTLENALEIVNEAKRRLLALASSFFRR